MHTMTSQPSPAATTGRANSPLINARVPENIQNAARQADPALADVSDSILIRVALLFLAGVAVNKALDMQKGNRRGRPLNDLGNI